MAPPTSSGSGLNAKVFGGFKAWQVGLVFIVVAGIVYYIYKKNQAAATSTSSTTGASSTDTSSGPLSSADDALLNELAQLESQISANGGGAGVSGGGGGGGIGPDLLIPSGTGATGGTGGTSSSGGSSTPSSDSGSQPGALPAPQQQTAAQTPAATPAPTQLQTSTGAVSTTNPNVTVGSFKFANGKTLQLATGQGIRVGNKVYYPLTNPSEASAAKAAGGTLVGAGSVPGGQKGVVYLER